MKKLKYWVLTAAMVLGAGTIAQPACALTVEDFESYANTAALTVKWQDTVGAPVQTLDTSVFHGGAKAMKLEYNCSVDPFENQLEYSFTGNQNWSSFNQFNVWVRSVEGETSLEKLTLQLKDEAGATLGAAERNTQIGNAWTQWSIDLSSFTGLAAVRKITLDVSAVDEVNGFGSGKLYFDDMSVVAAIPEPSTFGLMLLSAVGLLVVMKRRANT